MHNFESRHPARRSNHVCQHPPHSTRTIAETLVLPTPSNWTLDTGTMPTDSKENDSNFWPPSFFQPQIYPTIPMSFPHLEFHSTQTVWNNSCDNSLHDPVSHNAINTPHHSRDLPTDELHTAPLGYDTRAPQDIDSFLDSLLVPSSSLSRKRKITRDENPSISKKLKSPVIEPPSRLPPERVERFFECRQFKCKIQFELGQDQLMHGPIMFEFKELEDEFGGKMPTWFFIRMAGQFHLGVRDGRWCKYNAQGDLLEKAHYSRGLLDGRLTEYYYNGQRKLTGCYDKGIKCEKWTRYFKNGNIAQKKSYHRNGTASATTFYQSGALKTIGKYNADGKKDGRWTKLSQMGVALFEGTVKNGLVSSGTWKTAQDKELDPEFFPPQVFNVDICDFNPFYNFSIHQTRQRHIYLKNHRERESGFPMLHRKDNSRDRLGHDGQRFFIEGKGPL
jgi:hypothetical protein